jgi:alpha-D-ribose 1-methylphosphonate 5-triphosphate synthase subunit PhnL
MNATETKLLAVRDLHKSFKLHNRSGIVLPVLSGVSLDAFAGECLVLAGPSGAGKSTLLRCVYGNYLADAGSILLNDGAREVQIVGANHRTILDLRRRVVGYVSQFLRAIPRVGARDVVAEPLRRIGWDENRASERAGALLASLGISERMWDLPPATFSGGEQQRVNLARGFAVEYPVMLLDEPTSALDAENRRRVAALIDGAKARGAAVLGVFHDHDMADAVGTRTLHVEPARIAA